VKNLKMKLAEQRRCKMRASLILLGGGGERNSQSRVDHFSSEVEPKPEKVLPMIACKTENGRIFYDGRENMINNLKL
jgi:hypothetical protein